MQAIGFDNDKYLRMQSEKIRERIGQFGGKLYLEFGGKLFDDYHASRVLPGFQPDSKIRMLQTLKDDVEIVVAICAGDIEKNKMRGDLGISYDVDVLRLIYCFGKLHIRVLFRGFDGAVLKDIAVFSGFIAINMVVDQVNNNLDKLIITRYCGTAATAVYAVGQQLHTYFISFSTAVSSVFTPRIHQLVQDNKDDKVRLRTVLTELFVRVGRIQFLILSLVCTGIIFFGKPFIYFWAGPGYDDAYIIVLLLIIPGMVPLTQNLGIEMQRAQNLHKYRSIIYGAMAIGNLAISIWLCQYLGAIGCAIGTAVAVALANGLVMNIFYQRRLNIDVTVFWKNIGRMTLGLLPPAACGVLMMLFVNLYSIPMLLGGIIVYTAIYCASVWLLSMNGYEKALVGGMVRKVLRK